MANPKIEVEIGAITDKLKKGIDGSILSLNQLEKRAKQLQSNLENATDIKSIATYNRRLVETKAAISQLKTVGLESSLTKIGTSAGFASQGVKKLGSATSNYNSVGIDFARIIQDAPFGIIGVGNNITQLASSFQNARNQGKSFTQILGSIFSSSNLLILGVSALTTALTLYSMNANKGAENTDKLKEAYDDLADSAENAASKIASIRFAEDKIQEEIDRVLGIDSSFQIIGASPEQLTEIVNRAFSRLDKTQLDAFKSGLDELANDQLRKVGNELGLTRKETISFINSIKDNDQAFEELNPNIRDAVSAYLRLSNQVELTGKQLDFYKDKQDKATDAFKAFSKVQDAVNEKFFNDLALEADNFNKTLQEQKRLFEKIAELSQQIIPKPVVDFNVNAGDNPPINEGGQPKGIVQSLNERIKSLQLLREVTSDPERLALYNQQIRDLQNELTNLSGEETTKNIDAIINSFSSLGTAIGSSLNISNNALKGFITTLLTNTPKIIQAIIAQSKARKLASDISVQASAKEAAGDSIVIGTKAAKALGPVGLALLPVFVGGALALISGAFSKIGGGSSIGGGGVSGGIPKTFGGSGSTGLSFDRSLALTGEFRVKGQDLVYVFNEASSRNAKG